MINIKDKPCNYPNCTIKPIYNISGKSKGIYCKSHKLDGMIDVVNKGCIYPNCKTRPNYNFEGKNKGIYCFTHKLEGMVNVISKSCIYPNCKITPIYNKEGEKTALYCSKHKLDNMINIKSKYCIYVECKVQPCFNKEGEITPKYCAKHKLPGMINIKDKTCIHPNCKTLPVYNKQNETKGLYCNKHKLPEMINVTEKMCIYDGCKKQALCNKQGEKLPLYCGKHRMPGMFYLPSKAKKCNNDWCYTTVGQKYDGYCLYCYMNMFPDKPIVRNYKTKEFTVVDYIKKEIDNVSWIADKTINDGCSKKRPDLLVDLGYQVIIVEIDENQHINYDCSCENKRIMELSKDIGHRPLIFIRFNPDDYYNKEEIISSCWALNKNGISCIKKKKINEWNNRLINLKKNINYWLKPNNKTNKTIELIHLYYDNK